jgi:hypothetical protein
MMLTERQQLAQQLARHLEGLGAIVVSPLPLDNSAKLRFHVVDSIRPQVLHKLGEWNWGCPVFVSTTVRFDVRSYGTTLCSVYEIDLPREQTPIPTERGGQEIPKEVREFHKSLLK